MRNKIFDQLYLDTIESGYIVNRAGQRFSLYEIDGLDCYFSTPSLEPIRRFFAKELMPGATIEYFQYATLSDTVPHDTTASDITAKRYKFLNKKGLKSSRSFLSFSTDIPNKNKEHPAPDEQLYLAFLSALGVPFQRIHGIPLIRVLYTFISGGGELFLHADMSDREKVLQKQFSYTPEYMRRNKQYVKTLSLKFLPDESHPFRLAKLLDYLHYEYLFTLTFQQSETTKERASLEIKKRFHTSLALRNAHLKDEAASAKVNSISELLSLLNNGRLSIGLLSSKFVLWDTSLKHLEKKTERLKSAFRREGFFYEEETLWHDKEFFRSLPALTVYSKRSKRVLSDNYIDMLPVSRRGHGDTASATAWLLRNRYGELFAFDAGASHRNNKNGMIFGASGSGKSVTVNMMIAHTFFPNIQKDKHRPGRIFIVDFAGAENSSYLKMKHLFKGTFIPIGADNATTINLFPPRSEMIHDGEWNGSLLTFVSVALDLILENREKTMNAELYRAILSRAVRNMYNDIEEPILADLTRYIDDDNRERSSTVKRLLTAFLEHPVSALVNGRSSVRYGNDPFIIYDLQGISSLDEKLKELMVLLVVREAKRTAFHITNSFILFDEATQLIKDPRLVGLIDELFSTARKYNTGVWTITQNFLSFKEAALSSKVKINSTTTIFLSHANDEEAKRIVIEDFGFSPAESEAFSSLKTVKGEYATALIRTQIGSSEQSEVVRIELSPLDYALATSDKEDNRVLNDVSKQMNCSLFEAVQQISEQASREGRFVMDVAK